MPFGQGLAAAAVSAASLGVGASAGREGPMVHLGATLAAQLARMLRLNPSLSLTLLGCGVAAGVAASFNAPLAGMFFALEVVVGHYALQAFAPIVIASVAGTIISRAHYGAFPAFIVPDHTLVSVLEFPGLIVLGAICAGWGTRPPTMPSWAAPRAAGALAPTRHQPTCTKYVRQLQGSRASSPVATARPYRRQAGRDSGVPGLSLPRRRIQPGPFSRSDDGRCIRARFGGCVLRPQPQSYHLRDGRHGGRRRACPRRPGLDRPDSLRADRRLHRRRCRHGRGRPRQRYQPSIPRNVLLAQASRPRSQGWARRQPFAAGGTVRFRTPALPN